MTKPQHIEDLAMGIYCFGVAASLRTAEGDPRIMAMYTSEEMAGARDEIARKARMVQWHAQLFMTAARQEAL